MESGFLSSQQLSIYKLLPLKKVIHCPWWDMEGKIIATLGKSHNDTQTLSALEQEQPHSYLPGKETSQ